MAAITLSAGRGTAALMGTTPPFPLEAVRIQSVWRDNLFERSYGNTAPAPPAIRTPSHITISDALIAIITLIVLIKLQFLKELCILGVFYCAWLQSQLRQDLLEHLQCTHAAFKLNRLGPTEGLIHRIKTNFNPQAADRCLAQLFNDDDEGIGELSALNPLEEEQAEELLQFQEWQKAWDTAAVNRVMLLIGKEQQLAMNEQLVQMKAQVAPEKHAAVEKAIKDIFLMTTVDLLRESLHWRVTGSPNEADFANHTRLFNQSTLAIREAQQRRLANLALNY